MAGGGSETKGRQAVETLASCLAAIDDMPAVEQARLRVRGAAGQGEGLTGLVMAVESDMALALRVLRLANRRPRSGTVGSVAAAVKTLGARRVRASGETLSGYDPLAVGAAARMFERLRLHALSVQGVAERLAASCHVAGRDEILTAALLHDVGKLVLAEIADDGEMDAIDPAETPEKRVAREHRRFGIDHAAAGAWLLRHFGVAESLAETIAQHHSNSSRPLARVVRLADMLALYGQGHVVDLECLVGLSEDLDLNRAELSALMYELPSAPVAVPRTVDPCPLSDRELEVLRQLANGKVYKQIGIELGLSPSTVRSHLHRVYTRIGVADRTQAILLARERGWI